MGLGRMGLAIADRLVKAGHEVIAFDSNAQAEQEAMALGVHCVKSLSELGMQACIVWMMVPAGKPVDDVIAELMPTFQRGDIVIDGGNSFFKDSVLRYQMLAQQHVSFVDCGTSGGLHGRDFGFSLMVGGDDKAIEILTPIFQAVAAPYGYAHVGPAGSGHFVKMVHNGIEYALLQAYAEGFQLLKEGPYEQLDLKQIADVWNHGSIIRSWITELAGNVLAQDQEFTDISGSIGENLTGRWTLDTAQEHNVPVRLIKEALDVRTWSRQTGGNYATKLVALLRHEFGGHPVKKVNHD